ncbi:MAG: hypothetical protein ACK5HL_02300 [Bacilli bacterium]
MFIEHKLKLCIAFLLIIVAGISTFVITSKDNFKFASYYKNTNVKNNAIIIDSTKAVEIVKEGTGIIFFGFEECGWCQKAASVLVDATNKKNVDFYYLDVKKIRNDNTKEYQELISLLSNYLDINTETNEPRLYVPDVFFIKNGEIVNNHLGTYPQDNDSKKPLTTKQKDTLLNKYITLIEEWKDCSVEGVNACQ